MFLGLFQVIADAIDDIVNRYKKMMTTIAYSFVKDHQLSEDIVQLSLIRINNNLDKIDNIESKRTKNFIITITRHVSLSYLEKTKKDIPCIQLKDAGEDDEDLFDSIMGEADINSFSDKYGFSQEIVEALSQLSEIDKNIIIFKYGSGYSYREIAKIYNMSTDSVYKRSQRSLKKIGDILNSEKEGCK